MKPRHACACLCLNDQTAADKNTGTVKNEKQSSLRASHALTSHKEVRPISGDMTFNQPMPLMQLQRNLEPAYFFSNFSSSSSSGINSSALAVFKTKEGENSMPVFVSYRYIDCNLP
ncbi:hypothetical protein AVEN_263736-1 [Araneus ventricosus]|uniref:Uncharacterized protein n=1 Tax=Araneus ventricosus TaxID=182803 RepID=A0A4Y2AU66_ARAVE|nr:hypothetical protein AVEN_263736-1 [Araneus ventricosus]